MLGQIDSFQNDTHHQNLLVPCHYRIYNSEKGEQKKWYQKQINI